MTTRPKGSIGVINVTPLRMLWTCLEPTGITAMSNVAVCGSPQGDSKFKTREAGGCFFDVHVNDLFIECAAIEVSNKIDKFVSAISQLV